MRGEVRASEIRCWAAHPSKIEKNTSTYHVSYVFGVGLESRKEIGGTFDNFNKGGPNLWGCRKK